jgi:hypothetical protein
MLDDEQHLAEMVSLLGPPPPEYLKRSEKCYQYWDSQGIASKIPALLSQKDSIVLLRSLYNNNLLMSL